MGFLDGLEQLLGFKHQQQQAQQPAPDVTYNPNPNTNIPNSSHDMRQVQPISVAPAQASRQGAGWGGLQQSSSFDGGLQGYNQNDLSQGLQGGTVNQGYIPLQNSNGVGQIQGGNDPFTSYRGVNESPILRLLNRR